MPITFLNSQRASIAKSKAKLLGHTPTTWTPLWSIGGHSCRCTRCHATMTLTTTDATGSILKDTCNNLMQ